MLTREEIEGKQDLKIVTVSVPEWGGDVLVKELPSGVAEKFWAAMQAEREEDKPPAHFRERLIVQSVVDADGNRLFTDDDVEMLAGKCNAAINTIYEMAVGLSGISDAEVEETAKN